MRAGALFWPVFYEMIGRPQPPGEQSLARERDRVIHVAKDLSRTVDYLETRSDMDLDKLAYLGASWGEEWRPSTTSSGITRSALFGVQLCVFVPQHT